MYSCTLEALSLSTISKAHIGIRIIAVLYRTRDYVGSVPPIRVVEV